MASAAAAATLPRTTTRRQQPEAHQHVEDHDDQRNENQEVKKEIHAPWGNERRPKEGDRPEACPLIPQNHASQQNQEEQEDRADEIEGSPELRDGGSNTRENGENREDRRSVPAQPRGKKDLQWCAEGQEEGRDTPDESVAPDRWVRSGTSREQEVQVVGGAYRSRRLGWIT